MMVRPKFKSKVTTVKALNSELRKARKIIARERDRLREIQENIESLITDMDEGLSCLDQAIEAFSYQQ